jgi:protein-histidine N-methyltransferase
MAESTLEGNGNDDLISGLDTGDLSSGFYEGGFKTWECAIDLAGFVANHVALTKDQDLRVIELGAGSGVPSLAILRHVWGRTRLGNERIKFTFCDYNEEVLRLVTMPNLLLSWWEFCVNRGDTEVRKALFGEADLDDINEDMAQKFREDCKSKGVSFDFVSGGWGQSFVDLVGNSSISEADLIPGQHNVIILASETIYSPASLTTFVDTLADLLRTLKSDGTAFVAAKRIYFGVGGDVPEFVQEVRKVGGLVKEVANITDHGVGRVILEILMT